MPVIPDLEKYFNQAHQLSDLDNGPGALHHTLGDRPFQAAPGNHKHDPYWSSYYATSVSVPNANDTPCCNTVNSQDSRKWTELDTSGTPGIKINKTGIWAVNSVIARNSGGWAGRCFLNLSGYSAISAFGTTVIARNQCPTDGEDWQSLCFVGYLFKGITLRVSHFQSSGGSTGVSVYTDITYLNDL